MAQMLVRNVAPGVATRIKARAKRNGRSLEAELRVILEREAAKPSGKALAAVECVQSLFARRRFSDSGKLIREDRRR